MYLYLLCEKYKEIVAPEGEGGREFVKATDGSRIRRFFGLGGEAGAGGEEMLPFYVSRVCNAIERSLSAYECICLDGG